MKENLPKVAQRMHASATGGRQHQDGQSGRPGSVYHSNDDVGAGGLYYPAQADD